MSRVTFENATISVAIGKAARVAPTRGAAFDKAAGIMMTLKPNSGTVEIRVTNLDIYYLEIVDAVLVEGEAEWRFPSSIFSGVMSKLPIASGKQVTLEGEKNEVSLKSGRTTAKLRTMRAQDYPIWDAFDSTQLDVVPDLGARIEQVEWAADSNADPPRSGIHLDGEIVVATDGIRLAVVECEAPPIFKPITIPGGILKPVVRSLRDVAVGIDKGMFLLMPDPSTQIKTVIFGSEYPNVRRIMHRGQPFEAKFKKTEFLEIIDRAMVFGSNDRVPQLDVIIGKSEIAVMMSDTDQGFLGDVIEVSGSDHARTKYKFTPKNLVEALSAAPSEQVTLCYDPEKKQGAIRINGGSGYEAWVMPRRDMEGKPV